MQHVFGQFCIFQRFFLEHLYRIWERFSVPFQSLQISTTFHEIHWSWSWPEFPKFFKSCGNPVSCCVHRSCCIFFFFFFIIMQHTIGYSERSHSFLFFKMFANHLFLVQQTGWGLNKMSIALILSIFAELFHNGVRRKKGPAWSIIVIVLGGDWPWLLRSNST